MKFVTIAVSCITAALSLHPAHADETQGQQKMGWEISVMAGGLYVPTYLGDDDYQLLAVPSISAKYKDLFFASIFEGIGYNLVNNDSWRIGPVANYDFGRDESGDDPLAVNGDDTDDLDGLGDIDDTFEVGAFAEYRSSQYSAKLEIRQGLDGHEGLIAEAELKYAGRFMAFERPVFYSFGPEIVYGDDDYNSVFYDVNASQSAASGLTQFDADAGVISYGLHVSAVIPLTHNTSIIGLAGYDQLVEDAADSSLVKERGSKNQGIIGILVSYKF